MSPWTREREQAHKEYGEKLKEERAMQNLAGSFLAQARRHEANGETDKGAVCRELAEEYAAKALELDHWLAGWRAANGYD